MQGINRTESASQAPVPRARAIIEFIEGDLNRPPIVWPAAGSDELDEALRREILKRWSRG